MIQWHEVTWYSRLGAIILFIGVVPALCFYTGMQYQLTQQPLSEVNNQSVQHMPALPDSYKTSTKMGSEIDFVLNPKATITLNSGQSATDLGVTIALVSITKSSVGDWIANFKVTSVSYEPGSYSASLGNYVGGELGFADQASSEGGVNIKVTSIDIQKNTVTLELIAIKNQE